LGIGCLKRVALAAGSLGQSKNSTYANLKVNKNSKAKFKIKNHHFKTKIC